MKKTNIQWHPAFVSAMQLEFKEDRDKLSFEKEHNLNTKPLQIDLLIIRKEGDWDTGNEIGKLFRKYNIIEYKSPKQQLDIDVFYKTQSYAGLYKSYGETLDGRKAKDITVSIVRDRKPEKLFQYFAEQGIDVENPYGGIYYILGEVLFPTQIIVTKELTGGQHTWLKAFTDRMEIGDMRKLLKDTSHLEGKLDKEFAGSISGSIISSNASLMISSPSNFSIICLFALKHTSRMESIIAERIEPMIAERMEPMMAERERILEIKIRKEAEAEVKKAEAKVKEMEAKAKEEGIKSMVILLRSLGHDDGVISTAIMKQYHLSKEEINGYL